MKRAYLKFLTIRLYIISSINKINYEKYQTNVLKKSLLIFDILTIYQNILV